jgi:hypothetical protein
MKKLALCLALVLGVTGLFAAMPAAQAGGPADATVVAGPESVSGVAGPYATLAAAQAAARYLNSLGYWTYIWYDPWNNCYWVTYWA